MTQKEEGRWRKERQWLLRPSVLRLLCVLSLWTQGRYQTWPAGGKRGAQRAGAVSDCAHLAPQGLTRACGSPGAQPGPGCILMLGAEDGRRTPLWGQVSSFRDEQWTQPVMSVRPRPGQAYSGPLPAPRELTQHPITAKLEVPTWQIHTPRPDEV